MTKKDFVLKTVADFKLNPKGCLVGHGIKATVLNAIADRADVAAKLGLVLFSTTNAMKGAKGLKKSPGFSIKGYDTFGEFNIKGRADVEDFIATLAPGEEFENNKNIVVIVVQPDDDIKMDDAEQIVSGPSLIVPFESAIRKEQKQIGGKYLMIMVSDSIKRTGALKTPKVKVPTTATAQKNALLKKLRAKKATIGKRLESARGTMSSYQNQIRQYQQISKILGPDFDTNDTERTSFLKSLNTAIKRAGEGDKAVVADYYRLMKRGKKSEAKKLLKYVNPKLAEMILAEVPESRLEQLNARKRSLRAKLATLDTRAAEIMEEIDDMKAEGYDTYSQTAALRRTMAEIGKLRDQLGTYRNMTPEAFAKKNSMLAEVAAKVESLVAEGESINNAINVALGKTNATPVEKVVIRQQVANQIAEGTPVGVAIQQAVQEAVVKRKRKKAAKRVESVQEIAEHPARARRRASQLL